MKTKQSIKTPPAVASEPTEAGGNDRIALDEAVGLEVVADDVTAWATKINTSLTDGVASLVAAGRGLIDAKLKLPHGEFQNLFKPGVLRVDERTAQMLIRIARHSVLANPHNYAVLPPTLNTLYALSGLAEGPLKRAIINGKVTATTTIRDTKALLSKRTKGTKQATFDVPAADIPAADEPAQTVESDENAPGSLSELEKYLADYPARTREILRTHPFSADQIEANAEMVLALVQEHRAMDDAGNEMFEDSEMLDQDQN